MIGLWCNGSTTGFGSVCPGSNPGSPTNKKGGNESFLLFCFSYTQYSLVTSVTCIFACHYTGKN